MPKRVLIIGILFCIAGAMAIWEVIAKLFDSHISFNFAVCLLPVGIGLLKGKSRSRFWASFWIILGYLFCIVMTVMALTHPNNATANWFDHSVSGHAAVPYVLGFVAIFGIALITIHKLLYSEKSSAYFKRQSSETA